MALNTLLLCLFLTELAGMHSLRLKENWLRDHWQDLIPILDIDPFKDSPSDSTLCRILNHINEKELQSCVSETLQKLLKISILEKTLVHYALDGKSRSGVTSELTGRTEIDLTLFDIISSSVVAKMTLEDKQGEATAAPILIKNLFKSFPKIPNGVITFDCAMTTPKVTSAVKDTGNEYLGSLKGFNGNVYESIAEYNWGSVEAVVDEKEKGHGRIETRKIKIMKIIDMPENVQIACKKYADAACILRVERTRLISNTKKLTEDIAFYVGSSGLLNLKPEEIYKIQRGHWGIENKSNYVRDVTMKEDDCFTKTHNSSRSLSAFRDLVLSVAAKDGNGKIKEYMSHFNNKAISLLSSVRSVDIFSKFNQLGILQT